MTRKLTIRKIKSVLPLVVMLMSLGAPSNAISATPELKFDFGRTVECREVMSSELKEDILESDEKMIEMNLRVSVRLLSGKLEKVEEIRVEISDSDSRMRVHDFRPTTRLENRLSDKIEWTKITEKNKNLGASLGGEAPLLLGDVVAHITPSVNGSLGNREVITEKKSQISPKYLVVSSGTVGQEHGVFFKLRSSPQSSLEGVHKLTIRFIVPRIWRGDSLHVVCQATGKQKILWMNQHKVWAHTATPIALYLSGDLEARRAALKYVRN